MPLRHYAVTLDVAITQENNFEHVVTSVSETMQKPPLVKAQTALRKQK